MFKLHKSIYSSVCSYKYCKLFMSYIYIAGYIYEQPTSLYMKQIKILERKRVVFGYYFKTVIVAVANQMSFSGEEVDYCFQGTISISFFSEGINFFSNFHICKFLSSPRTSEFDKAFLHCLNIRLVAALAYLPAFLPLKLQIRRTYHI